MEFWDIPHGKAVPCPRWIPSLPAGWSRGASLEPHGIHPLTEGFPPQERLQNPGWNSVEGLDEEKRRWKWRLPLLVLPCLGSEHPLGQPGAGTSSFHSLSLFFPAENKFFRVFFFAVSVLEHGQERLAINYGGLSPLWRRRGKSREPEEGEHSSSLEGWG